MIGNYDAINSIQVQIFPIKEPYDVLLSNDVIPSFTLRFLQATDLNRTHYIACNPLKRKVKRRSPPAYENRRLSYGFSP